MRASMPLDPPPNKSTSQPSSPPFEYQSRFISKSSPSRPTLQRDSVIASPPALQHDNGDDEDDLTPSAEVRTGENERTPSRKSSAKLGKEMEEPSNTSGIRGRLPLESPETRRLPLLKAAIKEKMFHSQRRGQTAAAAPRSTPASLGASRVSPIKEETLISPTLDASFRNPSSTGAETASTESTESARTIRGSVPATPNQMPLRTPSYPFPYVPGTPSAWFSTFHRPFTTLSPTVGTRYTQNDAAGVDSEASTPVLTSNMFLPEGATPFQENFQDFAAPSLYDITLMLNMEPGLQSWWTAISQILAESYGVERASLAVPADAGELENVPWGQKATFNALGPSEVNPSLVIPSYSPKKNLSPQTPLRSVFDSDDRRVTQPSNANARARPEMVARHSFAGYERERGDSSLSQTPSAGLERPGGLLRTKSYAPQALSRINSESPQSEKSQSGKSQQSFGKPSKFSDQEFSSGTSETPTGPCTDVLPVLRALNHESQALLDTTGVNRVIDRGKVVILTRDYSGDRDERRDTVVALNLDPPVGPPTNKGKPLREAAHPLQTSKIPRDGADDRNRLTHDHPFRERNFFLYEEYEQFPSSPWAQSPAPSPAIQADPEENPFFTSGNVDEGSFEPHETSPDYAQFGQVEAIGIDKASTIIHIPLIHPLLSHNFAANVTGHHKDAERTSSQKKAPVAILSILSPVVPFPQSLANSLRLLGPHLATSFANADQYTRAHKQASSILQRRFDTGPRTSFGPFAAETESLRHLMEADIDISNDSTAESITSPSDYSGQSRLSPGGSIIGTPGMDATNMFSRQSVGTPLQGSEMIDSYFDAKKRSSLTRTSSGNVLSQPTHSKGLESPIADQRPRSRRGFTGDVDIDTSRNEQRSRTASQEGRRSTSGGKRLEQPSVRGGKMASPMWPSSRPGIPDSQERGERRRHSLLHSYGADFSSTFQSLPVTAATGRGTSQHYASDIAEESHDMPPPSERLLRTIIDSLPVQIFTAAPGSGALTWVNSKFVAYRGREPYQIIQDPWHAIHPMDRSQYMEQWQRSLSTGQPFAHKVRLHRFDNVYRWFFVRATPLKDKRQNIVHWTGTYMDVHEQHVAETNAARQQETAASEAKYRALANSSPQIVFAVTKKRGIIFCNSQWLTYSGQTEAQARHLGFMDFVHVDDIGKCRLPTMSEDGSPRVDVATTLPPETVRRDSSLSNSDDSSETSKTVTSPGPVSPAQLPQVKLSRLASTGIVKLSRDPDGRPSYSTEVRLRNKEGEYRWHLVRVLLSAPVRQSGEEGENGEEETWYGTCTDINDHKLLEQTLKDAMDAKSRFLSNMSHEIRTPLNGITGMVNFLIDSSLTQEQLEHVHIIRNSTEGLRDLINDILDLSKVEAGMITLQVEWLHVRSLIEEVNDLTSAMATGKGLELNYYIEDDVPSMVKGDRFRIRQVLLNVIGNAIKFTQQGEVFVKCKVYEDKQAQLADDEMLLLFDVIDTGSGFTEKEAEFLFKRFSQIDSSITKQHSGTGLGLAISMQLVELHGGSMRATSVPGKGSTFTFILKFTLPSNNDQPPGPETIAEPVSTVSTSASAPAMSKAAYPSIPGAATPMFPFDSSHSESGSSAYPSPIRLHHAESAASSGSSDPSIRTGLDSVGSHGSSASSLPESVFVKSHSPIALELPPHLRTGRPTALEGVAESSSESTDTMRASSTVGRSLSPLPPSMFSILIVCPLPHSRQATVKHIEMTIPRLSPHHITAPDNLDECKRLLGLTNNEEHVLFTHIVVNLHEKSDIISIADQVFRTPSYSGTSLLIISDFQQRKEIEELATEHDYRQLAREGKKLKWVFKPLKPSKFAIIFDPNKQRELSTDRSKDSAQAVVVNQKQVFDELRARLGNKGKRVLLVEDNKTNQMVLLKFLKKVDINVESVLDGVQCTDKVFAQTHDYFSIILCDLHMPNKDGYQTCKDIRRWERKNKYKHLPIIALSANVLGDVYAKCADAGFNSYVTKPVDFKELSGVMTRYLDPVDASKPHEFMRRRL